MTKEQIEKRLRELDQLLWQRARFLAARCIPYDMDDKYQDMLKEERELKELNSIGD